MDHGHRPRRSQAAGSHVRGPTGWGAYQADGSLADTTLTTMRTAAQALIFEQSQSFRCVASPVQGPSCDPHEAGETSPCWWARARDGKPGS